MEKAKKIELLDQQIAQANGGEPPDFNLWHAQTEVVLRTVVGDASPLYASFTAIRYTLSVWTPGTPQSSFDRARRSGVNQAIALLESAKLEVELTGGAPSSTSSSTTVGTKVFVVHGHDEAKKHEVARFIRDVTGNEPVILHEMPNAGQTVIEKFEGQASQTAYAIVIATADDLGRAKGEPELSPRARQNVVLELGFFFGALGRRKVAMLYDPTIERPSDIAGLVTIPLDAPGAWKMLLARELNAAGVPVDWSALGK